MPLACNIDRRGQIARRIWGWACIAVSLALAALAWFLQIWWLWIIAPLALAAGLFALYEARKKWCVMCALGVKTPM